VLALHLGHLWQYRAAHRSGVQSVNDPSHQSVTDPVNDAVHCVHIKLNIV
jgi:hypothetical protein